MSKMHVNTCSTLTVVALLLFAMGANAKESTATPLLSCPAGISIRWVCINPTTKQPAVGGSCSGLCVIGKGGLLGPEKRCDWVRTGNGNNWEQPDGAILASPRDPKKPITLECMTDSTNNAAKK